MHRSPAQDPRLQLLHERRTVAQVLAPGPDAAALDAMLAAAETAPDHGRLRPWRFLLLDGPARDRLSTAYAQAQSERGADPDAVRRASSKPLRGPCVIVAFARTVAHPTVPAWEQLVAAGCAVHNLCLAATALGFGSAWRTGWFVTAPQVRAALGAAADEQVIGLIHIGTPRPEEAI